MIEALDSAALLQLAESASRAALDPSRWATFVKDAERAFGAAAFTIELSNKKTGEVRLESSLSLDSKIAEAYEQEIFRCNPRVILAAKSSVGSLCYDRLISEEQWRSSRDYIDWLAHTGTRYSCWGKLRETIEDIGFFSIHFEERQGLPSEGVLEGIRALIPNIQNALEITKSNALDGEWRCFPKVVDEGLGGAYALIAKDCRLVRISAQMESILERGDVLTLRDGQLAARNSSESRSLTRFISSANRGAPEPIAHLPLLLRGLDRFRGIVLRIVPLPKPGDIFDVIRPAALLVAVDLDAPLAVKLSALMSIWGLTPREAELALSLAQGLSVERSALKLGMATLTARHHLKSIFRRMEIEHQSDLVRLVSRLG